MVFSASGSTNFGTGQVSQQTKKVSTTRGAFYQGNCYPLSGQIAYKPEKAFGNAKDSITEGQSRQPHTSLFKSSKLSNYKSNN